MAFCPGVDQDLRDWVENCDICNSMSNKVCRTHFKSWTESAYCMERIHLDHAFLQKYTYVLVERFSRFILA